MDSASGPIGLIAGKGKFPLLFAQEARKHGRGLVVIALKEEANEDFSPYADAVHRISVGKLESIIQALKKENVSQAVMAGRVEHVKLFSGILPDLRTAQLLLRIKDRRADSILRAVADELGREGITVLPSITFLSSCLPAPGVLTRSQPGEADRQNIDFGIRIAQGLSAMDVGQTVVVKRRAVLAVEALEGTDACIRRGAALGGEGVVVVKSAKPGQDLRFDVPVIGTHTISVLEEVKAKALAIEAGRTLMLEMDLCLARADGAGISVTAWKRESEGA